MFNDVDTMIVRSEADARQMQQMQIASVSIKKVQDAIARAEAENWQREWLHGPAVVDLQPALFQRAWHLLAALLAGKSANRVQEERANYMGHGMVSK
jgi:hypothetical protein